MPRSLGLIFWAVYLDARRRTPRYRLLRARPMRSCKERRDLSVFAAIPSTRRRSCWRPGPTRSGTGTSRSSWADCQVDVSSISGSRSSTIFSRYVVGWMLAPRESAALERAPDRRRLPARSKGSSATPAHRACRPWRRLMTSKPSKWPLLLADLGVTNDAQSPPTVSNDNPVFRSLSSRPWLLLHRSYIEARALWNVALRASMAGCSAATPIF